MIATQPLLKDVLKPRLSVDELQTLLDEFLPGSGLRVKEVSLHRVVVMAGPEGLECRPGGTLSGPTIFKAVDLSAFLAVNAYAGRVLTGVLTHGSINLLDAAQPGILEVVIELAKLGRRMAVANARVFDTEGTLIAVATMQFALPSRQVHGLTP
ncbi:Acyl-coenzyme A thioesterase PaaI, contains HGG motif [Sinosporangium album]|uniref:Acyl-coenzyme A thioesterase PaaI, contains HGG motif n=1 Tax=Sinosporangium album TaxID=504805 RepID=A0A1G8EW10_9ACTN|nr:PaaI family thioesterase [Sinosporangium album]SDH74034.1 Acyl-coenzyme A thioesterase PaaI, contains HGG motif [Sinosporangium album]